MKLEFSRQNVEKYSSNDKKIHPVGAESFNADRRTDMTKRSTVLRTRRKQKLKYNHNTPNVPVGSHEKVYIYIALLPAF